ncbi:phage major tail tube protein [Loktanella sp. TSTF-M6]|uniref:Phage major tail tube protein n=1 Tax=Loktanella gaetbuli TaxID=2881335 RepID=A0ABS8BS88_9RHOB|nr:phage major tail tube protein [Loktanella gaetbuli]MCB5198604.1 phage major tail tube protein [Loktanella gaetbuli]
MSFPRTIRNYNAFLDGVSYMGLVSTGKLPALKIKTAAHRGAGMDAETAVDMGMEAMTTELTFDEWSDAPIRLFGSKNRIVLRPAAVGEDDFAADTFIFAMGGRITDVNWDDLKAGTESKMKAMMDVDFFSIEKNGQPLVKIDVENGVRVIDGVDQLAGIRAAMGL